MEIGPRCALVVVDVQQGFDDAAYWGPRDNPRCEDNVRSLLDAWRSSGRPVVLVRHASTTPGSPLAPDGPGYAFQPGVDGPADLVVTKSVNSGFHGAPALDPWLRAADVGQLVICGITTNHCCETTARVAGNLGYDVLFATDATHTHDRTGPDGTRHDAAALHRVTDANLHGEFATVTSTAAVLAAVD